MPKPYPLTLQSVNIDQLVSLVVQTPVLWKKTNESEPHSKNAAWKEIADEMGVKVHLLKLKWKNVRDIYRREFIRHSILNRAKLNKPDDYTGKWRYFKQLWNVFEQLRASCYIETKLQQHYDQAEDDDEIPAQEDLEAQEDSDDEFVVKTRSPPKKKKIKDIVKHESDNDEYFDDDDNDRDDDNNRSESVFVQEFVPVGTRDTEADGNYDQMYLNSLLPFFKMLSPVRKLHVRNLIQEMLIKELHAAGKK